VGYDDLPLTQPGKLEQKVSEQSPSRNIETVEQKTVLFYDDELVAVRGADNQIYVSVSHLCRVLDIDRRSQVRRIREHAVLSEGYSLGKVNTAGGAQTMGLLRVDLVPLWLTGLETSRVGSNMKDKLERYQREAAKVLWEAFQEGRLTATPSLDELLQSESPAAQAYQMAMAIADLARNQLMLEARLDRRLEAQERRLERLETQVSDTERHVSPEQASQISQAVKAVAMVMSRRSGRNEYGGVYGELYRRFGITSYKLLPANRFQEAMDFLTEWHQSLTGETPF
jgi:hypothetical protein